MKLKNVLIVVQDIEKAGKYYRDLFGLEVISDCGEVLILTEGLVLQEGQCWENFLQRDTVPKNNHSELYFEESGIEEFAERLEKLYPDTEYVTPLMSGGRGKKLLRFYDPDGNLIEVGSS